MISFEDIMVAEYYQGIVGKKLTYFVFDGYEPADAADEDTDCWMCGRLMHKLAPSARTRVCKECDVWELVHTETYIPKTRSMKCSPIDATLLYVDHSKVSLPSPA
jgi:hypothetical protein